MWFDLLPPNPTVSLGTQNGYSVYSFMVLYLLARYIRLYGLPERFKKNCLWIYMICSILLGTMVYLGKLANSDVHSVLFAYSNPVVILSSVAFLMTFERINIQSKFINHIAKSTLAVLLGHSAIFFLYTKQFNFIYKHYTGIEVVCYWVLSIVIVFVASILIDLR